jgi:hypothetical protein
MSLGIKYDDSDHSIDVGNIHKCQEDSKDDGKTYWDFNEESLDSHNGIGSIAHELEKLNWPNGSDHPKSLLNFNDL